MSVSRVGQEIRSSHPWAYRTGEWGLIVSANEICVHENLVRGCYQIRWPDGKTDDWAIADPVANYEFRERKTE